MSALAALALELIKAVLSFFLTSRVGNIMLAAGIAFTVADINRSIRDHREFAARTAAFEQAQRNRDKRIAQETRDQVWTEIANATAENTAIDQEVKEFHDALPPVPAATINPFLVGDASCRLRHIAGYAGCGPDRAQGMPKAGSKGAGPGTKHWTGYRLPRLITHGAGRVE